MILTAATLGLLGLGAQAAPAKELPASNHAAVRTPVEHAKVRPVDWGHGGRGYGFHRPHFHRGYHGVYGAYRPYDRPYYYGHYPSYYYSGYPYYKHYPHWNYRHQYYRPFYGWGHHHHYKNFHHR